MIREHENEQGPHWAGLASNLRVWRGLLAGSSLGLGGQPALVAGSLVAVDQALVDHGVDDGLGILHARAGGIAIAGSSGLGCLADGRTQARTQRHVAGAMLDRL